MTAPPAGALEACLALLEKATPGEWHAMIRGDYGDGNEADVNGPDGNEVGGAEFTPPGYGDTIRGQMYETDARAIAAAVNLLRTHGPALLAALRLREGWAEDEAGLPINDAVPAPTQVQPGNLFLWNWRAMQQYARTCVSESNAKWQSRCLDLGFKYWRAPDAHGVECTHEQALALLRELLGVEVDITTEPMSLDAISVELDEIEDEIAGYDAEDAARDTGAPPTADDLARVLEESATGDDSASA